MNIITLTLNPAFDIHCYSENFKPYHENLAKITSFDAGGKGINISRALAKNGIESTAVIALGEENGDDFLRALSDEGIRLEKILLPGRIRENITLHTSLSPETRISFKGFLADDTLLEKARALIWDKLDSDTVVTFTGTLPEGVSIEGAKKMLKEIKARGAKTVIDSKSFKLSDLIDCAPWLIKPNEEEIEEYTGVSITDSLSAVREAEKIRAAGIENVMISLGKNGAVLASSGGDFIAKAPTVNAVSTIGAGDSSIAGFLLAAKNNSSPQDMLKLAVCYGSAACMTEGTKPPRKNDILTLLKTTEVIEIK